jgi:dienelactone hydrolase
MPQTKRLKRIALSLALGLGFGAIAAGCAMRIQPATAQVVEERARNLGQAVGMPESAAVSVQEFAWQDGARSRAVPAKLYMPTAGATNASATKPPLVVFSHGIGGSKDGYSYIGRYLAANGIAALHVQHIGSDRGVWYGNPLAMVGRLQTAAQAGEAIDRAKDVSFALSQVLQSGQVDAKRVAAAGHSYGANTTMLVAGARVERENQALDFRDPRIGAAVIISAPPFYGEGDARAIVGGVNIPTLHITATGDEIKIPGYFSGADDRIKVYEAMGGPSKTLAVFSGGSHSMFTDRLGTGGIELNPKVKVATRELTLAFLRQTWGLEPAVSVDAWKANNAPILARFEQRS